MRSIERFLPALVTIAAAVGCSPATGEPPPPTGLAGQALRSDPSTAASYEHCQQTKAWNGVTGDIRYPKNGTCSASFSSPLVVVLRGTGYAYDSYDYLLGHLASNGFIAVSIDVLGAGSTDHAAAVAKVTEYMGEMLASWTMGGYIDPSRVALVGHSRGGATARHVADALKGDADPWTVRALVGLAGVNGGELDVTRDMTPALLLLHGGDDSDVLPANSYWLYDHAGTEASITPSHPEALHKSMKILEHGTHQQFSESSGDGASQLSVTKGYVLAFLAAHLRGDAGWYESYIQGDAVPHGWPGGEVVSQRSDGSLRRVIDDFEDGELALSAIGGAVVQEWTAVQVLDLLPEPGSSHMTHALRMIGHNDGALVEWSIPAAERDADAFRSLSFRIVQTTGTTADDLMIQIRNSLAWSPELRVSAHGSIPRSMTMCTVANIGHPCNHLEPRDQMGTVRVPLAAFGDHGDVSAVRFRLRGDTAWKTFLVDSLELSESALGR